MQAASSLRFMYPPLAAPILLVGYHGLLFEALAPYFTPPKKENTPITCSAGYYLRVHGTTPDSIRHLAKIRCSGKIGA